MLFILGDTAGSALWIKCIGICEMMRLFWARVNIQLAMSTIHSWRCARVTDEVIFGREVNKKS